MSYRVVELVLDNGPADGTETLLLAAIAENATDAGYAFPGVAKLAHRARRCERHVIRLIQKMAADGWLSILPKAEGVGRKLTAYQLNLEKLSSSGSHATQIADEKAVCEESKRHRSESHAAQIAHEQSHDILPTSHVTFDPESHDILPIPILINHEPSLEPSGADAPGCTKAEAQSKDLFGKLSGVEVPASIGESSGAALRVMGTKPPAKAKGDPRHYSCRVLVEAYMQKQGCASTWGEAEAGALSNLLKSTPGLTVEDFEICLLHRAASDNVAHGSPPRQWLASIQTFRNGPLDRFKNVKRTEPARPTPRNSEPDDFDRRRREAIADAEREKARKSA